MTRILDGQVAVVTGASRGIGRAIALALAGEGARVVVNYVHNQEAAEETAAAIREAGGEARTVQGDVSDRAAHARILDEAISGFGRLDILVNNAGIYEFSPVESITEAHFRRQFHTKLCCDDQFRQ